VEGVEGKATVPTATALCSTPAGDLPNQTKPNTTEACRKQFSRRGLSGEFPREIMRDVVLNGENRRPFPARWLQK